MSNDRLNLIMQEIQSDKKNFENNLKHCETGSYLNTFVHSFESLFQVAQHNQTGMALQYIQGLLKLEKGKANMERMEEEIPESEYRSYQHFITNSKWDYKGILSTAYYIMIS